MDIIDFKPGYYLYAGSAMSSLTSRTDRHTKNVKNKRWHIDYIHPPIKHVKTYKFNGLNVECEIAEKLSGYFTGVFNFGCSDCKCKSHLFYSPENPDDNVLFVKDIFNFRFNKKTLM